MRLILLILIVCLSGQLLRAQCPPGTNPSGIELVTNGDFQNGNTGFTSGYNYTPPPNVTEGQYWVATGAQVSSWNGGMSSNGDHTTGTGNFLLVNGSPNAGTDIWCQTITVTQNTQYLFSAWISTLYPTFPAIIQFYIDGAPLGSTATAPSNTGQWIPFNATWNSGSATSISICIVNQNTSVGGNDFGIDDISFQPCGCGFVADAGSDKNICPGSTVQLNSTAANSYTWLPATDLSCNTCQSPVASPTVTTTYTLSATNNGCTDSDEVVVQVYPPVNANAGNDVSVCKGATTLLQASGGITYAWQPPGDLSNAAIANPTVTPTGTNPITYTVTVTDANNCSGTDNVTVSVYPAINADAGPDTTLCPNLSVQLNASGGSKYNWFPTDGLSKADLATPVASPKESSTYTVTITDANNCTAEQTISVEIFPDFFTSVSNNIEVCPKETVVLIAKGGNSYAWSPPDFLSCLNCDTVTLAPTSSTVYTVKIADLNGCEKKETVAVNVRPSCVDIFMPTAFSPNKDGVNDLLSPISTKVEKLSWHVYNRWGENVFNGSSINNAWDGTFRQLDEPVGVYVWFIEATFNDSTTTTMKGNVTLLR